METTTNAQMGLLDSLTTAIPTNDFLERLDRTLAWRPIEKALQTMYPATTGRPPCAPLAPFKMSLLQHCYSLSDPQCEELVTDRLSWRRFVGLGLQEAVPDETTPMRFRQRLREHGLHERLLALVNRQLEQQGLILKTCTLVDATLLQAARRAPAKEDKTGGDGDAGYTVKGGQPHYGYKAHVAVDETHTLIRQVTLTAASVTRSVEDLRGFQKVRLQPGETREVTFRITPEDLKFYNGNLEYDWEPGEFIIRIGGDSTSVKSATVRWSKKAVPAKTP